MAQTNKQLPKPVDWDQLYPGRFLKSGDLQGKKVTVKIADVILDELEGEKGKKVQGVIILQGTDRQIALNKTNGFCLRGMFGRALADWQGKRITLMADKTRLGGDTVDCIRIYGSPDIAQDMKVTITLPRRKPFDMTMHAVRKEAPADTQADSGAEREPGADDDRGAL